MSETDNTKPATPPDPISLITQAGKLNYPVDRTVSIVRSHHPGLDKDVLLNLLSTSGTKEYEAYHTGKEAGMFEVESGLYAAAAGGDGDAQKALQNLRVERTVGDAIKNKFFPDTE
ncbi:MAG: hypothetical protein E6767_19315 [Dysgonomonas sp.]|nr:hypothetical protein [Dysgonomonas sp.]